jgi:glycosyltransferase involved in cell wall biosynthesis
MPRTDNHPRGRIGIIHPWANFDSIPSLVNAALLLAGAGYHVDVFTLSDRLYVPPTFPPDCGVQVIPLWAHQPEAITGAGRLLPAPIYWRLDLLARHARFPYRCLIGVDPQGLVTAQYMAAVIRVPVVYYSLELLLSYEVASPEDRNLKARELTASRTAAFSIIQDDERAALLIRDNGLDPAKVLNVPNAPLGPARRRRSNYLRDKLGIPADRKIILHTGNLGAHMGSHQLVHSTHDWPEDWMLVCHTRLRFAEVEQNYMAVLKYLAARGRVIFSTEPVSAAEYAELVCSADVGVAFYCPQPGLPIWGDNIRYIGLSSGKFAACLAAGIPVLVNDVSSLRRMTESYGCGAWTADPAVTRPGIERILANYEACCEGAVTCFNQELDVEFPFQKVLARLEALK